MTRFDEVSYRRVSARKAAASEPGFADRGRGDATRDGAVRPVCGWALVGAGCLIMILGVWRRWLLSDEAHPTPVGSTPVPSYTTIATVAWQVLAPILLAACAFAFVVRPWRRERRMTLDGLLFFCFLLLYWWDPLCNYTQVWQTMSSTFVNLGSWTTAVPGAVSPKANAYPEPLLMGHAIYVYFYLAGSVAMCALLDRTKARWPHVRNSVLVLGCFAVGFTVDLVLEVSAIRLGLFAYGGAIGRLSLFSGTAYQYPVYEGFMLGGSLTAFTCLRYFRNDRGFTFAERGLDRVLVSDRMKTTIRFLALLGFVNVTYFTTYFLPNQFFGLHSESWPQDLKNKSYLMNGICGPGTEYACPSPAIPIPRPHSSHVQEPTRPRS